MATLLRLAYDGTDFRGFARQHPGGAEAQARPEVRTVQAELEAALARLYKRPVLTRGASRTDAGVHARGQIVAFDPPFAIPPRGLLLGLAGVLPRDVIAHAAWEIDDPDPGGGPFNPRFHTLGKLYRYQIRAAGLRDPLTDRHEWHLSRPIDVEAMRGACPRLVGALDFAGFRASDCQAKTTRRRVRSVTLRAIRLDQFDPLAHERGRVDAPASLAGIEIDVRGDAFLKNMVRVMVGTLVAVGRGQFGPERIDEVLASGVRARAGATAPAQGLSLIEVFWPRELGGRGRPEATEGDLEGLVADRAGGARDGIDGGAE